MKHSDAAQEIPLDGRSRGLRLKIVNTMVAAGLTSDNIAAGIGDAIGGY